MSVEDDRQKARDKLKRICGVYRNCDGDPSRICQGQSYGRPLGIGGIGTGASFANNAKALNKIRLQMQVIGGDFIPQIATEFFGTPISMPVMSASVSGVNSFGGDQVITEKDFCRAVVLGCKNAGTIGWRGHTYTYSIENAPGIDSIREAGGWGVKIVKPIEQSKIVEFIKRCEEVGAIAVGIDVDGCGSYMMAKHNKPVFRKTQEEIKELVNSSKIPFIVKGIMCVEDAIASKDAGVAAICVSNHGGRVLDYTPGTAEVLPDIVQVINKKIPIFVDGGVRTGYDVLKMLALGADGVLMGRDVIRAAIGGGIDGVQRLMEYVSGTLIKAMKMTNCSSIKDIRSDIFC